MEDAIDNMAEDKMEDTMDDMAKEVAPLRAQVHVMSEAPDHPKQPDQTERQAQLSLPPRGGMRSLWTSEIEPAVLLEVEIGQPLPTTAGRTTAAGRRYHRALMLVRLHSQPIGLLDLPLWEAGMSAHQLALNIWEALGPRINEHLINDGLMPIRSLSPAGVPSRETPPCLEARQAFLARAPFVSVVIPTHDRAQQVVNLVQSILASEYPADQFEVIVVDNAPSGPDTAQSIAQAFGGNPQVRYTCERRAGSSRARNRGVELARGEIVAFADDDVRVDRHWLAEITRGFETSEDVGCVTSLIVPMELETPAQQWFEQFGGFCKSGMTRRLFNLTNHRDASPLYPFNVGIYGAGASMAFRRSALLRLHGFDPSLGPATLTRGGEDIDAMLRLILGGQTLLYAPAAIAHHCARRERQQLYQQIQGYGSGLAACLFKTAISSPGQLLDVVRKLPRGLAFAFSPWSTHHAGKHSDYPLTLTLVEARGFFYGPVAYILSRRRIAGNMAPFGALAYPDPRSVSVGEAR